jgi:hypothetical protein
MWYNMWAQNFSNISNGIQISAYLYKRCLVGKGNITPDHNTTATKGCNWLDTAFRMLFPPPAPDLLPSICRRQARISSVNKTFFHCCLVHRECALAHLKRASRCRIIKIAFLTKSSIEPSTVKTISDRLHTNPLLIRSAKPSLDL